MELTKKAKSTAKVVASGIGAYVVLAMMPMVVAVGLYVLAAAFVVHEAFWAVARRIYRQ